MLFDVSAVQESTFQKISFFNYDLGTHKVRFLGPTKATNVHYVNRTTIKCLGEDCPICKNNRQIQLEHPNDYWEVQGYNRIQKRHYANVLDRTVAKICPQCSAEVKRGVNGQFPPTCPACNTFITGIKESQLNVVKVINISNTNAAKIEAFIMSNTDSEGQPISPFTYDFGFMVTMINKKKDSQPMPMYESNDAIDDYTEKLYDLDKAVITLNPEEVSNLVRGISLKDIFAARRSTDKADAQFISANEEEVKDQINKLFSN